jgi:phosphohistidine phosphatase
MALYLVQHGKSLAKEIDPEQGLSEDGIAETERIAALAKEYGVKVSGIAHSGKKRARQTAEFFAAALRPKNGVQERGGLNPLDDVVQIAATLDSKEDLMLVGHLPFMERLTSYLITRSIERPVFKFQNGGIVCLDKDPEKPSWFIKWALMPMIQ